MGHADYRKHNDRCLNSSTYHKKDGTPIRGILKEEARREIMEAVGEQPTTQQGMPETQDTKD